MNPEVKALWITALRGGDYIQGHGKLAYRSEGEMKYCCLGVLCDLALKAGIVEQTGHGISGVLSFDHEISILPEVVAQWAGTEGVNPTVFVQDEKEYTLAELNDGVESTNVHPHTFTEIANMIEEKL